MPGEIPAALPCQLWEQKGETNDHRAPQIPLSSYDQMHFCSTHDGLHFWPLISDTPKARGYGSNLPCLEEHFITDIVRI